MNMELTFNDKIQQTRELLHAVRGSSIKIGQNLYEIKQALPKDVVWADLLQNEFDIRESQASKLMTVYRAFVLEGGLSHAKLETVDAEKLYMSLALEGTPEEKLAKATNLTRRELREERVDDGHEHSGETVLIHKCCGMKVS